MYRDGIKKILSRNEAKGLFFPRNIIMVLFITIPYGMISFLILGRPKFLHTLNYTARS